MIKVNWILHYIDCIELGKGNKAGAVCITKKPTKPFLKYLGVRMTIMEEVVPIAVAR